MKDLLLTWRLRRRAAAVFGWRTLRPAQLLAMRALLRGRDAMVILPTGAGKSAVYQVPATLLHGPTVVISPLLALQQDQIAGLSGRRHELVAAVRVSSAESPRQQQENLEAVRSGAARFLFITPEQLASPERLAQVRDLRPSLVAVDEAHCLSSWGHDFRPDYLTLGETIAGLAPAKGRRKGRRPPIVALTATASPPVRDDIAVRLRLNDPQTVVTGLDRPNLFLEAIPCPTEDHRWRRLTTLLAELKGPGPAGGTPQGSGIVYVPTRRQAEELASRLREAGHGAQYYHGGMASSVRTKRHEEFLAGQVPVMVATSAFGMGIDKPDIRWVVHLALPDSPDSYLQEIGRAGRDGAPARAVLLYRAEDVALQRYFAGGAPPEAEIRDLVAVLRERPHGRPELRERSGFSARKLTQLLTLLTEIGVVTVDPDGRLRSPQSAPVAVEAARAALSEVERHQAVQRTRVDMMRQFAESRTCRSQSLLTYFGDRLDGPCGHCDNCAAAAPPAGAAPTRKLRRRGRGGDAGRGGARVRTTTPPPTQPGSAPSRRPHPPRPALPRAPAGAATRPGSVTSQPDGHRGEQPFPVGGTVRHPAWGTGTVLGYEEDRMTVLFDSVGYKTLSVGVVRTRNLLDTE
jgi:ATP-dependent DNA helicase RecQ